MYKTSSLLLSFIALCLQFTASAADKEFYQIKIYHLKSQDQELKLDSFLKDAYLPALHRHGIKNVGVFKPVGEVKERLVYVFVPFKSFKKVAELEGKLLTDNQYAANGRNYLDAAYNNLPYERIETILLTAFDKTGFEKPILSSPGKDRIYELRSYEGHTEKIFANKVKMFVDGDEIGIFKKLGFNAIFYGEVVAGSHMPNLMYMTSSENKSDRDKHWEAFGKDEDWKKLSARPEYQNNVSHIDIFLLYPAEYSDI